VRLDVYDVAGRRIRSLVTGVQAAGAHRLSWDGLDDDGFRVRPGAYFARLQTEEGSARRRLVRLD